MAETLLERGVDARQIVHDVDRPLRQPRMQQRQAQAGDDQERQDKRGCGERGPPRERTLAPAGFQPRPQISAGIVVFGRAIAVLSIQP
jgi:hypothetical protein